MQSGSNMDISMAKCKRIISDVEEAVGHWNKIAENCGIRQKTTEAISHVIDEIGATKDEG